MVPQKLPVLVVSILCGTKAEFFWFQSLVLLHSPELLQIKALISSCSLGSVFLVPKPYLVLLHSPKLLQVKALTSSCSAVLMTLLFQCCAIMAFMLSVMFKASNAG